MNLAMHLIRVSFQCGGAGERDRGLIHGEEAMLDVSAAYGPIPFPSGRGHRSNTSTVLAISSAATSVRRVCSPVERLGSEIQAWNDGILMCSITKIGAAGRPHRRIRRTLFVHVEV